jgi:Holliday junction resolvasome RuvABC endonuclease subunit
MLLTLDVGFKSMGWALIEGGSIKKCGVIETEKSKKKTVRVADDRAWRSANLARELSSLILCNGAKGVIGELPSGGALNAKAMAYMAMATAITAAVCEILKIPVEWVTPGDSKKALTGKRSASKEEMMATIRDKFLDLPLPAKYPDSKFEHVADAIAAYNAQRCGNLVRQYG